MKKLQVERPHEEIQEYPWDIGIQRRFCFDSADIERLEEGKILWQGETAFTLEDN